MRRADPIEAATFALRKHYPDSLGGFAAGSVMRGHGTATSDIDLVVLYDDAFEDVHRSSVIEEGWPIEFFVHNAKAQDYFFEQDRQRGVCVMPSMVASGTMIPESCPELIVQQRKAQRIVAAGPPPLEEAELEFRRYLLTDLLDDLIDAEEPGVLIAILARVHELLGDFALRGHRRWSGHGKALLRCLRQFDAELASRFQRAFAEGFGGDVTAVVELADSILAPFGGRLWAGYRASASDDWKAFRGSDDV
jgi:hypothetical protein